jgi:hypothetical protein
VAIPAPISAVASNAKLAGSGTPISLANLVVSAASNAAKLAALIENAPVPAMKFS